MVKFLCILEGEGETMEKADYNIASVTKALQLIDLLSRKNGQLSVQALAEKLDVSPSNVTRLCRPCGTPVLWRKVQKRTAIC